MSVSHDLNRIRKVVQSPHLGFYTQAQNQVLSWDDVLSKDSASSAGVNASLTLHRRQMNTLDAYPCGSDHTPSPMASRVPVEAAPLLDSPNTRLTAVTVSVMEGHTIVFLGDSKGNLHKVFLGPSGEAEKYATIMIQSNAAIGGDLLLDQSHEYLYIMTQSMVVKRPVAECSKHLDCQSCLSANDPYCGWCVLEGMCGRRSDCLRSSLAGQWMWSYDQHQQCLRVQSLTPSNISREEKRTIFLSIPELPALVEEESYSCFFEDYESPAVLTETGVTCSSPDANKVPPIRQGEGHFSSIIVLAFLPLCIRCGRRSDCLRSSLAGQWMWSYDQHQQCLRVQSLTPSNISREEKRTVFLGPSGEAEKYATIMIQSNAAIGGDLLLDQSHEYLYIMTQSMVVKRPVAECSKHLDCQSCLSANDPYCGWCVLEGMCGRRSDCLRSSLAGQWMWSYDQHQQCLRVQSLTPSNISREEKRTIFLSIPELPALVEEESYSCFFEDYESPAVLTETGVTCSSPDANKVPPIRQGEDYVTVRLSLRFLNITVSSTEFTFYDCSAVKQLSRSMPCRGCVSSQWGCNWCVHHHLCTHKPTCEEGVIIYNKHIFTVTPTQSPTDPSPLETPSDSDSEFEFPIAEMQPTVISEQLLDAGSDPVPWFEEYKLKMSVSLQPIARDYIQVHTYEAEVLQTIVNDHPHE
ncbi:UNVERIFIED_CONTAM: hypothetical protein FKN15_007588 [Acipenser sinensis]